MEPNKSSFWTNFGAEMDPEMDPQKSENVPQNGTKIGIASGEQKWGWKMQILSGAGAGAGTNHVR